MPPEIDNLGILYLIEVQGTALLHLIQRVLNPSVSMVYRGVTTRVAKRSSIPASTYNEKLDLNDHRCLNQHGRPSGSDQSSRSRAVAPVLKKG